jgi:hypothetical protein
LRRWQQRWQRCGGNNSGGSGGGGGGGGGNKDKGSISNGKGHKQQLTKLGSRGNGGNSDGDGNGDGNSKDNDADANYGTSMTVKRMRMTCPGCASWVNTTPLP